MTQLVESVKERGVITPATVRQKEDGRYELISGHRKRELASLRISYKRLWILLIEKDVSPATLRKDLNIATGTMTKLRRNEEVALSVLLRICEYLDCNIGDICDAVKVDTNC